MREVHKREINAIRKQLYKSRQQGVRYKKRIQTLTGILHSLKQKNLLPLEDMDIIENFSKWNKNLLYRQIRKMKKFLACMSLNCDVLLSPCIIILRVRIILFEKN